MQDYKYPMDGYVTVEAFAKMRGLSKVRMYEIVKTGRLDHAIVKDRLGKMNVNPEKANEIMDVPTVKEQMAKVKAEASEVPEDAKSAQAYTRARTGNEVLKYQMAQIELEQLKGSLIEVSKVRKDNFLLARILRDQLLSIPERISAQLVGMMDEREIYRLLKDQITEALKAMEDKTRETYGAES